VQYDGNWVILYSLRIWHDPVIFPVIDWSISLKRSQSECLSHDSADKLAIKIIYDKNGMYFLFCSLYNSLRAQLVKHDIHTTRNIKFIHAILYHILLFYQHFNLIRKWYKTWSRPVSITASIEREYYRMCLAPNHL